MAHLAINFRGRTSGKSTNKELRTALEMYMRLFQTPLLLKNEESIANKSIKGSKHLRIAMESLRRRLASLRRRC